ncbi:hypothetical protein CAPTEDRAFT_215602 [Capitella teleta]|uniref:Uncharacterized protein n=1 Tax=Capitella teleta TaxID=283909 RepID=R7UWR0_CAPTE|nr:hypothetical protein CAPTEDRAFT_215602 [Capitella teleta]|eukprot:ELU11048.1 hypothetical protein CAPTEDRAFT_215602 [Capitella teleta]
MDFLRLVILAALCVGAIQTEEINNEVQTDRITETTVKFETLLHRDFDSLQKLTRTQWVSFDHELRSMMAEPSRSHEAGAILIVSDELEDAGFNDDDAKEL